MTIDIVIKKKKKINEINEIYDNNNFFLIKNNKLLSNYTKHSNKKYIFILFIIFAIISLIIYNFI
jgi:hypothetical protein